MKKKKTAGAGKKRGRKRKELPKKVTNSILARIKPTQKRRRIRENDRKNRRERKPKDGENRESGAPGKILGCGNLAGG